MKGLIPGNGKVEIVVTFKPQYFNEEYALYLLTIDSFGFKPFEIKLQGNAPSEGEGDDQTES